MAATAAYNIGALIATMGLDTTQYQAGMASVQASTAAADAATKTAAASMSASMAAAGVKMQAIGKKMTRYMTLPILAIGVAGVKTFSDFESSMAKIVGLVGVAKGTVEAWKKEVLALGPATGQGPDKLADALFFITSAGIRGAEALEVLEMAAKAATAGMGEAATIADLVTSAMNAYGKENLSAAMATDILTATVREGKAEASSLAMAMGMVLPIASEYGVTFDQVGAAFAGMTRTGTNARVAATQLKAILSSMASPSDKAEAAMKKYGTSSAKFRNIVEKEGLIAALLHLREATEGNKTAMAEIFPNIRGLMGVLDLLGKNVEGNKAIFDALKNSTGALDTAFISATDTMKFRFNKTVATMKTRLIGLGTTLSGSVIPILEKVTAIIERSTAKWDKLSSLQKQNRIRVMALTAAMGPLLSITGRLMKLMATPKGPYMIAIAGAIALTLAIRNLIMKTREQKEVYDAVASANEKVIQQYEAEAAKVTYLTAIIEDENVSREGRLEAIKALKAIFPGYKGDLTDEGVLIEHNKDALIEYLAQLKEKIRLQVFEGEYVAAVKKEVEAQRELDTAITAARIAQEEFNAAGAKKEQYTVIPGQARAIKQMSIEYAAVQLANEALAERTITLEEAQQAQIALIEEMKQYNITLGASVSGGGVDDEVGGVGFDYEEWFKQRREWMGFVKRSQKKLDDDMSSMADEVNARIEEDIAWQLKLEENANRIRKQMDDAVMRDKLQKLQSYIQVGHELASALGAAISGQEGAYKSMVSTMLAGTEKIIAALLAQAVAGYIANKAAIPGGLIAIAIGVPILMALWNNLVPEFAEGALVSGPTVGMIGEYPGARHNPEVIAPLDKLQSIIGDRGPGMPSLIEFKIKRRDLVALIKMDKTLSETY